MMFRLIYGTTLSTLIISFVLFAVAGSISDLLILYADKPFGIACAYAVTTLACAALVDDGPNSESYSSY